MDANPITARRRTGTRVRVWVAVGSAALAVGVLRAAPGQTPAAVLKPARPLNEPAGRLLVRGASPGASPNFAALGATSPASPNRPTTPSRSPSWLAGPSPFPPPAMLPKNSVPQFTPASASAVQAPPPQKSFLARSWDDVKEYFGGPPPTPLPYRTQVPYPTNVAPPVARVASQSTPVTPPSPGVYAGPPAYRWYGWGSTTPGANPYAPTGHSPRGSATWYVESGATPGAFPVPVMNPVRPPPATTSPVYTGRGRVDESVVRPASGRSFFQTGGPTPAPERVAAPMPLFNPIATTPEIPVREATPTTTVPVPPVFMPPPIPGDGRAIPIAQTIPGGGVVAASVPQRPDDGNAVPTITLAAAETSPAPELTWQSASGQPSSPQGVAATPPIVAQTPAWSSDTRDDARLATPPWVSRGQVLPTTETPSLDDSIRDICYGRVIVTTIRFTGPSTLLVRFTAATEDDARAAAEAISRLPQLRPYEVRFEVSLAVR